MNFEGILYSIGGLSILLFLIIMGISEFGEEKMNAFSAVGTLVVFTLIVVGLLEFLKVNQIQRFLHLTLLEMTMVLTAIYNVHYLLFRYRKYIKNKVTLEVQRLQRR
ncbi:hypothetical protein BAU15_05840 [Enterococcus sp. JM4C]|uniref:hypothetical protein n=1 Tax=Candidatus Enterococcus huntleyi TaxID=1857217 RepID=UPI00137A22E8|nr:hypothetical protein [Enterococcus sp. JM4C]KAF1297071.1 hypothetical protein BAU15_05840 [Enterococcus sp. JM4C]